MILCDDCTKPVGFGDDNFTESGGALCRPCKHKRCIQSAERMLSAYSDGVLYDFEEIIQDALTDLFHFAIGKELDLDHLIRLARMHLEYEKDNG